MASVPRAFMESLPFAGDADANGAGDAEPVDAKALVQAAKEKVRALSSPPQRSATCRAVRTTTAAALTTREAEGVLGVLMAGRAGGRAEEGY